MKKLAFLFLIASLLTVRCDKEENSDNNYLQGTWVESELKTDTIQFDSTTGFLWLSRGTEIRNGYELPKAGSSVYSYNVENDSIFLQNLLSSSYMVDISYYFYVNGDTMTIGNFYDSTLDKMLLDFIKVE